MRCAVIDLGTNTFHLLIAEITVAAGSKILFKTNLPVKLGEGTINENRITDAAFERGIAALAGFKKEIEKYNVTRVKATATAAVRSARNGKEFVIAAKERAGIIIEVISGDQEATYIYKGVKASGAIEGVSLIMDIGGGSTEFIICDNEGLKWKKSFDIGAARLMQQFFRSDPLSKTDEDQINAHIRKTLEPLESACQLYHPTLLIGSAGAFETFAGMLSPAKKTESLAVPIELAGYLKLADIFIRSTHRQRAEMEGLVPLRTDMIVMATLLINYALGFTGIKQIKLSTYDLKMGVLQEFIAY